MENKESKFEADKEILLRNKNFTKDGAINFLKVSEENYDRCVKEGLIEENYFDEKPELVHLYQFYKKYLYIEDYDRIDVGLAVWLSSQLEGIPLWVLFVGASGDMKSLQLSCLEDENSFILHNLTSKTLVNGYTDKIKHPDLAPLLNNKIIIIPDMAQILKLPPSEKGEIWGQLRDLYDGLAGKVSGQGSNARYKDLKVTLMGGSTPAIDGQILIHQDLGTRELIYRTRGNVDKSAVMNKCFENEELGFSIDKKLKEITNKFMESLTPRRSYISKKILDEIKKMALFLSYMRASAEVESFDGSLRGDVYPEEPTRIVKQLKRLYVCLISLADDYPEKKALRILWHIVRSSSFQNRLKLLDFMLTQTSEISTTKVSEALKIGKKTAYRELNIFHNLNIVILRKEQTTIPDKYIDFWKINLNKVFVQEYKTRPLI